MILDLAGLIGSALLHRERCVVTNPTRVNEAGCGERWHKLALLAEAKRQTGRFAVLLAGALSIFAVLGASTALAAPPRHHGRGHASSWQPEPATFGSVVDPNVSITMDDGVVLVGDVMYPADPQTGRRAPGKFPVLLTQNPYSCDSTATNDGFAPNGDASYFAERGYIYAAICVRGTGRSGGSGQWQFFGRREQLDGVTLVDWAAHHLDGSNGVVGLTGCSYLGNTQQFTAGVLQPGSPVKAILPECAGAEFYRGAFFSGGMPTQSLNFFGAVGQIIGPQAAPFAQATTQDILSGGNKAYFRAFWQQRTPGNWAQQIVRNGIPSLLWDGWYSINPEDAQSMYAYMQNAYFHRPVYAPMKPGSKTTPRYQIIIGAWGHGGGLSQPIELEWFDTWLRGERTPMATTSTPMHLYQLGSDTWINTTSYPMVRHYTRYYLQDHGALAPSRPTSEGNDSVSYTLPTNPGGSISYTSAPLEGGATLAGPISATLYASSSSTNLNLIATLNDVAPDGTATKLTSGSLVGSLRALDPSRSWVNHQGIDIRPYGRFTQDDYLKPGRAYKLSIGLSPRVAQLAPGHSLRLTITTQTPPAQCTTTLGVDPCFPTAPQRQTLPGTYRVEHAPAMASAINLPVLPYKCFAPTGGTGVDPDHFGDTHPARRGLPCDYR